MDYQRFIEQLPGLYENWGQPSVHPQSRQFQAVLDQIQGMTTANAMQLLNWAVECMEPDEVYCEIGCFQGATLIGALLNHPEQMAYAVDNFSEFDDSEENFERLSNNLSVFDLDEQVIFCNQDFEEFFFDLRENQAAAKIGVYLYDGAHDYRSQLLGLLLVRPFLADKALIIVDDTNWSPVQQANWDFMAAHPECQLLLDLPTPKNGDRTFWNGIQVFRWDVNQPTDYNWSSFVEKFRDRPFIQALYDFKGAGEKEKVLSSLSEQALALNRNRELAGAEQKYKEVLQADSQDANAYHNLGMVYYEMSRYKDALKMLLQCLEIDSTQSLYHYSLGLIIEKIGNSFQAIRAYEKAIALNPQLVDAYNNLGNILSRAGELEQAESIYRQSIAANPNHFGIYLNLGNVLIARQQVDAAIECYEKSLQLKPQDPDIIQNLKEAVEVKHDAGKAAIYFGEAAYRHEKYEQAIIHYQKLLPQQAGEIDFYIRMAYCYKKMNRHSSAITVYQEGIKHYPTESNLYMNLVITLQEVGRLQEAIAVADSAVKLLPNDLALRLVKLSLMPIIYENTEQIEFYRRRFSQRLEELIQGASLDDNEARNTARRGIGVSTNFYLQYQGKNDLVLQKKYGEFAHKVMAANYPQWAEYVPRAPLNEHRKIRVGYISACMFSHTVAGLSIGWLRSHNHETFEVYCYYIDRPVDLMTQEFNIHSDVFRHITDCDVPKNIEALCEQILADKLDVLVFIEIGMYAGLTQIAGLRLAPVQCLTWGHPITSGIPTLDYFLSSDLMEPENAEEHYSEKLIRLPNLGFSYAKPVLPETRKIRSDFQLRDDAVVYLSCQSLFKYLPQHDYILPAIAQRVPQAQFAFIASHVSEFITEQFWQRLQKAFAGFGLNIEDYCLMLQRVTPTDYLNLNLVSDIFLDSFSWSGGKTTLEAIACNLPVVTCPGEFMRGRHSYGILQMLGVTETIAKDEAEYIEIAIKLGLDKEWRQSIVQQISQNHGRLYDDKTCVEALESFYQRVVREGQ